MYQNDHVHTFIKASFQRVLQLIMPFCIRVVFVYCVLQIERPQQSLVRRQKGLRQKVAKIY